MFELYCVPVKVTYNQKEIQYWNRKSTVHIVYIRHSSRLKLLLQICQNMIRYDIFNRNWVATRWQ